MKKHYFILSILILIMSCSKEEATTETEVIEQEEVNLAPNDFNITISNLSHSSVTINWSEATDPEGEIISYTIYLDGKLVAENISGFGHQLMNLTELTNYSGKVVAKDSNNNETAKTFSFITEKYYLKYLKTFDYDLGSGYGNTYSMLKTTNQNYIIAGRSFRPDGSNYQFFILKIDNEGNEIWKKFYDYGLDNAWNFKIIESSTGLILVGHHHLLSLDNDGNVIWYKKINSYDILDGAAEIKSVAQDSQGNIFTVGGRGSTNPEIVQEAVITKFDNSGNIIWEKTFMPSIRSFFDDLLITSTDELIVLGSTETNGATFPQSDILEQIDFWVLKLSNEGKIIWQNSFGDGRYDFPSQIIFKSNGNYVFAGYSWGAYDIGGGRIFEISPNGNEIWNTNNELSSTFSIAETQDNGFITTGQVDFGNYGGLGIYKFDSNGNEEWNQKYQEPYTYLLGNSILTEEDGGYRIAGTSGKNYYYGEERPKILIYKTDPKGNYK